MQPDDIGRITSAASPAVSPDGRTIAFVVGRVDLEANRYRSAVWLAAADGTAPPYQFTSGDQADGQPAWSPDGRRLAFTSRRGEGDATGERRATLHVAPVTVPGEVVTLAERDEGFGSLAWSPDGAWLAFTSRVPVSDDQDDRSRPPRRIDRLMSRLDGEGWTVDRPSHVFTIPADGSAPPRQLTTGPYDHDGPAWSPDGSEVACIAARHDGWDLTPHNDVFVFAADGSTPAPERVTGTDSYVEAFSWAPSAPDRFALVAQLGPEVDPGNARLLVLDRTGGSVDLSAGLDRTCAPHTCLQPPVWDGDDRVVFAIDDRGAVVVMAAPADGSRPAAPIGPTGQWVTGYDVAGGTLGYTASTADRLPELFAAAATATGAGRRLSTVTDRFHRSCPSHPTEAFVVPGPDGDEIDAWAVVPAGVDLTDRDASVPMLLSVHGGPFTQYGVGWFDEFQLWASAGFVVVFANPRGSSGRSEAWGRAIRSSLADEAPGSGWGGVDADDLLAVADAALARWPGLDPERTGVLGGSYGGYMTSWLLGHTGRFAAGCSERAVNNLLTLETSSDVAGWFRFVLGVSHLDHPEELLARSPISAVRSIRTPLLILHSENDLRCPIEQADQLFVALRMLEREVEYHRFPAEGHELSRSGSPKHRVQRAELIIEWFTRHLRPSAAAGTG